MKPRRRHDYDPACVAVWIVGPLVALASLAAILKAVLR